MIFTVQLIQCDVSLCNNVQVDSCKDVYSCVCIYLCKFEAAVGGERGDFAGVLGDVAVKARCWIEKVLHVFIDALHFPLKPKIHTNPLLKLLIALLLPFLSL